MSFAEEASGLARAVVALAGRPADELERQLLAAFLFGAVNALALERGAQPPEAHGATLAALVAELGRAPGPAAEEVQFLIEATAPGYHPTVFAVIHRGMEGYYSWAEGDGPAVAGNFADIVRIVREEA